MRELCTGYGQLDLFRGLGGAIEHNARAKPHSVAYHLPKNLLAGHRGRSP